MLSIRIEEEVPQRGIKAKIYPTVQVVRIRYSNDRELKALLDALWKVPGMDIEVAGE